MNFLKLKASLVLISLALSSAALGAEQAKPKYGPQKAPIATTLANSTEFFRKNPSPDFWSLIGYYVPQFNGYACSAASVSMVINAARAALPKTADDMLITQKAMLEKVNAVQWKDRLSDGGSNGSHGLTLDQLGQAVEATFKQYGFPDAKVKVVHINNKSQSTQKILHKDLVENQKTNRNFILANFNQKAFTDDAEVGHIAPVAAYDAARKRVLVLDPDRDYYEPYWVSEESFLNAMNTEDKQAKTFRGYVYVAY